MVYTATGCNNYKDIIILLTQYLYWRGYILLASKYLFRGIQFVPNYCICYYRSNNSLVLFSILLLVLVSRINHSILTRYIYSRNSNILYTEFYHISQGKSISCYGPTSLNNYVERQVHAFPSYDQVAQNIKSKITYIEFSMLD